MFEGVIGIPSHLGIKSQSLAKIIHKEKSKSVFCEVSLLDSNYVARYNSTCTCDDFCKKGGVLLGADGLP